MGMHSAPRQLRPEPSARPLTHPPPRLSPRADGGAVLQQRHYHNFRQFRIFDLSDHKMSAQHLIGHPMALQRLAAFLQEQHFQTRGQRKPVVLIGPRSSTDRCLVIGYEATQRMRVRGCTGGAGCGGGRAADRGTC